MKVICECGKEGTLHSPPEIGETMLFAIGHGCQVKPRTVKVVCACGAERTVGPGVVKSATGTGADIFMQGMSDRAWFEKHASHEAN